MSKKHLLFSLGFRLLTRLWQVLPVLVGVSIAVFLTVKGLPGDPAKLMLGERANQEQLLALREKLGLNQPLITQYGIFIKQAIKGDFGTSIRSGLSVNQELKKYFPATLELALAAIAFATIFGVTIGMIAAVGRNGFFDLASMFGALLGVSMPIYWLGLILIMQFSVHYQWLPVSGRLSPEIDFNSWSGLYLLDTLLLGFKTGNFSILIDLLKHMVLPTIALGTIPLAIIARITRSSMLEVLGEDYIRTARAKGLDEFWVVIRHGLKNAMIPILTVIGLQTGFLLGGAILTEKVFSWPGIGNYILDAVLSRDIPAIQGGVLLVSSAFVFVNLLVDSSYSFFDPRLRN